MNVSLGDAMTRWLRVITRLQ